MSEWGAWNHGAGRNRWFLMRADGSEYRYDRRGRLVRYASFASADKAARRLNAAGSDGEG